MTKQYANQSVLCETDWVSNNLNNNQIKILEEQNSRKGSDFLSRYKRVQHLSPLPVSRVPRGSLGTRKRS